MIPRRFDITIGRYSEEVTARTPKEAVDYVANRAKQMGFAVPKWVIAKEFTGAGYVPHRVNTGKVA